MMCQDIPGQPPRRKIATCACGSYFPDCDLEEAIRHITCDSSPSHVWVWRDPEVKFLIPDVYQTPKRVIHKYD